MSDVQEYLHHGPEAPCHDKSWHEGRPAVQTPTTSAEYRSVTIRFNPIEFDGFGMALYTNVYKSATLSITDLI
jgi:hypothetical protein